MSNTSDQHLIVFLKDQKSMTGNFNFTAYSQKPALPFLQFNPKTYKTSNHFYQTRGFLRGFQSG